MEIQSSPIYVPPGKEELSSERAPSGNILPREILHLIYDYLRWPLETQALPFVCTEWKAAYDAYGIMRLFSRCLSTNFKHSISSSRQAFPVKPGTYIHYSATDQSIQLIIDEKKFCRTAQKEFTEGRCNPAPDQVFYFPPVFGSISSGSGGKYHRTLVTYNTETKEQKIRTFTLPNGVSDIKLLYVKDENHLFFRLGASTLYSMINDKFQVISKEMVGTTGRSALIQSDNKKGNIDLYTFDFNLGKKVSQQEIILGNGTQGNDLQVLGSWEMKDFSLLAISKYRNHTLRNNKTEHHYDIMFFRQNSELGMEKITLQPEQLILQMTMMYQKPQIFIDDMSHRFAVLAAESEWWLIDLEEKTSKKIKDTTTEKVCDVEFFNDSKFVVMTTRKVYSYSGGGNCLWQGSDLSYFGKDSESRARFFTYSGHIKPEQTVYPGDFFQLTFPAPDRQKRQEDPSKEVGVRSNKKLKKN